MTAGRTSFWLLISTAKKSLVTERMMRTLKEELCWLREWSSATELKMVLDTIVENFNDGYRHSALGYQTPNAFKKEHFENRRATLNLAA